MKKLLSLIALFGVMFALSSCGDDDDNVGPGALSISGIPATAEIAVGDNLEVSGVVLTAVDGFASSEAFTVAVGTSVVDLSALITGASPQTINIVADAAVQTALGITGAGTYTLVFTLTDANGDEATFSHELTVAEFLEVVVSNNITSDVTWTKNKIYILNGRISVEAGNTLTIEEGTIIKGEGGTGSNASALLIARGAMINAVGTAAEPIIFTTAADEIVPGQIASPNLNPDVNGLWGGLIILGNAPISADNESEQIEGIPASDSNGLYGGTDAADNSGTIRYISVRHGGANIGEGNEINGITLGGVGSGTTIDHVEVVANQDDGIEWFGGTVNVSHALVWNAGDDAIDTDQAWSGTLDNFIIINPGDEGFELDGPEGTFAGAGHTITNGTMKAEGASGLADFDDNTDVNMTNVLFFDISGAQDTEGYGGYLANTNGFASSAWQAVLPDGSAIADFFTEGSDAITTSAADVASATVGANVSEFAFTFAEAQGALDDF